MSVLHCLWNGGIGGAERAVYQLVSKQIDSAEIAPGLLFGRAEGPYYERALRLDCPVVALHATSGTDVRTVRRAARAMGAFDVHHFHSAEPLLMTASMFTPRRRVYTHRGAFDRYPGRRRARYEVTGVFLRRAVHGVSANTAHAADAASRLFRMRRSRFHITYNGLDFDLLAPREPADRARRELGLEPDQFVIGTTAHLRSWKRIDRMLEALAALRRPDVRAVIVGDGPDRPRLEERAVSLGVSDQTIFTGWRDQVADLVQAFNAFCMPSSPGESFGNSAVEAMALGVPTIIFADGGGLLEHVLDSETGFVVGDAHELAAVLRRLIDDPGLAAAIGRQGRAFVRERYTLDRAVERYAALYRESVAADRDPEASDART